MPAGDVDTWNTPMVSSEGWSPDDRQESSEWPRMLTWDLPEDPISFMQVLTSTSNPTLRECRAALDNFCSKPPCIRMPQALQAALYKAGIMQDAHVAAMAALRANMA